MSQSIGIGMVGYKFMGKAHSNAYRQVNQFFDLPVRPRLKTICGRDQPKVEKMAQRLAWENAVDDWRRIIDDPEIRIVDICSPNNTHHDIAIAAFEVGKNCRLRKADGDEWSRSRAHGGGGQEKRSDQYRLVQLP